MVEALNRHMAVLKSKTPDNGRLTALKWVIRAITTRASMQDLVATEVNLYQGADDCGRRLGLEKICVVASMFLKPRARHDVSEVHRRRWCGLNLRSEQPNRQQWLHSHLSLMRCRLEASCCPSPLRPSVGMVPKAEIDSAKKQAGSRYLPGSPLSACSSAVSSEIVRATWPLSLSI